MNQRQTHPASVLLAVTPAPLKRVVEHLLGYSDNLQIVGQAGDKAGVVQTARRLLPDIAIVSERLIGRGARAVVAEIRQASPRTKLLVIRPGLEFAAEHDCGADAYVREYALVRRLNALLNRLSAEQPAYTVQ